MKESFCKDCPKNCAIACAKMKVSVLTDQSELKNGYSVVAPKKYSLYKDLQYDCQDLTLIEKIVYAGYASKLVPLSRIASFLNIRYNEVKSIYRRAYKKIEARKSL